MHVHQAIVDIRRALAAARRAGRTIGFVPTMGALHAGHTSLIDAARRDGHEIVVSIFVNPTQFGPTEDFTKYPRTLDRDLDLCRRHGASLVFMPGAGEMYPPGDQTRVRVGPLAETMCGRLRPGHFEGVCTVVAKLFNFVQPDAAYFGQKDAQQAIIIRRMVADLFMPLRIIVCPTVRESDGLAMSSRNAYLTPADRLQATSLFRSLSTGRDLIRAGERRAATVTAKMREILTAAGPAEIQYIAVVDPETLADQSEITPPVLLALAVKIGSTRLIDNMLVGIDPNDAARTP